MDNRIIKYRCWDTISNSMIQWEELLKNDVVRIFESSSRHTNVKLMQFTGLKDSKGVEIYEGDLLRYPGDPKHFTAYEVFFHDGDANSDFNIGFCMYRTHHQGSICGGPIPSFKPKSVSRMEICGNIFQNPELLTR